MIRCHWFVVFAFLLILLYFDKNFFLDSTNVLYEGFQIFLTNWVGFYGMCFERFIYEFDSRTYV